MPEKSENEAINHAGFAIAEWINSTIKGLFLFVASSLRVAVAFTFMPSRISVDRQSSLQGDEYPPPFTYFLFSLLALFVFFAHTSRNHDWYQDNMFMQSLIDAVSDANIARIILYVLPYILLLGCYSFCLQICTLPFRNSMNFEKSSSLAAYFVGTMCLAWCFGFVSVLASVQESADATPGFLVSVWVIAGLIVIGKAVHSFLHLLKRELETNWPLTLLVAGVSTGLFSLVIVALLTWIAWENMLQPSVTISAL